MVKPPQPSRLPIYDWQLPLSHLARIREEIEAAARVLPLAAETAIIVTVRPLEHRYAAGERSPELYEAMLKVKFRS